MLKSRDNRIEKISLGFKLKHKEYSFQTIFNDVLTAAENLRKAGFKKNDAILIFVPMSYELYVTILAVFYIGATVVSLMLGRIKNAKDSCDLIKPKGLLETTRHKYFVFPWYQRN